MRYSLRSGNVSSLRGDGFIFSRNVCLDRFALAARHDLAGAGRLRWDDNAAVVLQRYKAQREQEFCLVQEVTSFLWDGADLLKVKVSSLAALLSTHRFLAPIMYQFTVFRIGFFQLNVFYVELLVLKNIFQL